MDKRCVQIIGLHDICRQYDISLDQITNIDQNNHCIDIIRISSNKGDLILKLYKTCPLLIDLEDFEIRYEILNKLPKGLMPKPAAPPAFSDSAGFKLFGQLFYPIEGCKSTLSSEVNLAKAGKWLAHLHRALNALSLPSFSKKPINGVERMSTLLPLLDRNVCAGSAFQKDLQCIQNSLSHIVGYQPMHQAGLKYERLMLHIPGHIWFDTGEHLINPNIDFLSKGSHTWDLANILQTIETPQSAFCFMSSYLNNGGEKIIGLDLMINMFLSRLNSLIMMSFDKNNTEQTVFQVREFAEGWCLDILKNRPFLVSPLTPELFRTLNINGF